MFICEMCFFFFFFFFFFSISFFLNSAYDEVRISENPLDFEITRVDYMILRVTLESQLVFHIYGYDNCIFMLMRSKTNLCYNSPGELITLIHI